MTKIVVTLVALTLLPCAFAVDGVVLINQSTVLAAGGFPYVISQPGSYKLSGNLTVPDANTTAIFINANNVSIDLNGFSILGPTVCTQSFPTTCSPTGIGLGVDGGNSSTRGASVTVFNGSVHGIGGNGIFLFSGGGHVENVHADQNGGKGIEVQTGIVRNSTATLNGSDGIYGFLITVSGNTVYLNGGNGIKVGCPSSVVGNTSVSNGLADIATDPIGCALANNAN
jgi:hypothetical protein